MDNCIFCKISSGEIPSYKIYEDNNFFAFLDIRPLNLGHALIVPKEHARWVWDVPEAGAYFEVVKKIALAQKKAFSTDFIASVIYGEEVPHAHIWLVPRFENDGHPGALDHKNIKQFSPEEMKSAQDKIVANL